MSTCAAFAGFATGLLISVFSKTLVLLAGLSMVIVQVGFSQLRGRNGRKMMY